MPPPLLPPPDEVAIQVRKLRYEVRRLRYTVIICALGICAVIGLENNVMAPFVALAVIAAVLLAGLIGAAKLFANGWDAVSMRWQRARWQAERNKPVEEDEKL
ncbi:MAG TPA: hypothetical protein VK737_03775 [Opitutales bacterium]|jgi:hypothetical protein|nr:hypothetical protein [Opitutales bacterium]